MFSNDITDIIAAAILLFILALAAYGGSTVFVNRYSSEDISLKDEQHLFLLNYLRTETAFGDIADLIAKNENGDSDTLIPLQKISGNYLNFYRKDKGNYILKIGYPDGKVNFVAASHDWSLPSGQRQISEEQRKLWFEIGDGEKIKIPSLNKGLITLEFKTEDE
ncbi:hypothetical protein HYV89_03215 [Candidatus Woesearchaeota archaeon]|nr:hypothetical protein [Candidatus Woesearchaeota archaeon]